MTPLWSDPYIKFIDWFAGIGGFRLGLEKANTTATARLQQGFQQRDDECTSSQSKQLAAQQFHCVGACELDKYARKVYARHWHEPEWGDSRTVDPDKLPDFDLFCAGFPCQSFSIAGKRRGFEDTRGTLFFEICRIVWVKRPRFLLLENVKGLLSHDEGDTFQTILRALDELGYDCQWEVLNSKNFGVPQNRERVFIVGCLRGQPLLQVFPLGEDIQEIDDDAEQGEPDAVYAIDSNYGKGCFTPGKSNTRTMIIHENKLGIKTPHVEAQALRSGASHNYQTVNRIRRLTPLECERLQGFPDNWTEGISDTQCYKCLGNAVTVNIIQAIGERLLDEIMV